MIHSVYQSRAHRNLASSIERDPEPMVQQQLARLQWVVRQPELNAASLLDVGCGTGFNAAYFRDQAGIRHYRGLDLSHEAVALARESFHDCEFLVADACQPDLNVDRGQWDVVVGFEVLEHVDDRDAYLANIARHLAPGGVAFVSTPNRPVFSLGHEPSPMNREHVKELDLPEIKTLLGRHFRQFEIFGQRFKSPALLADWHRDTRNKIAALASGTRWAPPPVSRGERWRQNRWVDALYAWPPVHASWKAFRQHVIEPRRVARDRAVQRYAARDFEIVPIVADAGDALWFVTKLQGAAAA